MVLAAYIFVVAKIANAAKNKENVVMLLTILDSNQHDQA